MFDLRVPGAGPGVPRHGEGGEDVRGRGQQRAPAQHPAHTAVEAAAPGQVRGHPACSCPLILVLQKVPSEGS